MNAVVMLYGYYDVIRIHCKIKKQYQSNIQTTFSINTHRLHPHHPTTELLTWQNSSTTIMDMDLRRSENFDKDEFYDQEAKEETNRLDHLKLLLFDLNSAIAPKESRLTAIFAILDEFDHTKKQLHNQELEVRADHILLQKLSYALCIDPDSDEVGFLCHALEMVYRGSKKRVATSFHEVSEALLPILVDMIRAPMNFRHNVGGAGSEKGSTKGDPMEDVDFLNEDHPPSPQSAKGVWEDASSDGPFQPYGGHQDECYEYEEGAEETKETILTDEDDAEEELASALAAASLFSSAQESVNELMRAQRIGQEEEERKRSAQVGTMIISQQQPETQWLSTRVNAVQSAEQQQEPITGPISDALVLQPVEQQQYDQHPMISSEGYYQWNPMPQGSTTSVDGLQDENGVWRPNIPLSNNGEGCHSGPNPNLAQIEDSTPPAEQEEVVKDDASASKKTNIKNSSTDAAHCDESMISDPSSASKQSSSLGGLAFYGLTDKSVAEESMISDPSYNSKQSSSLGGLAFYGLTKSVAEETDEDRSSNKSVEDEADNVMHIRGGGMGSEETKEPHSYQNEESYFSTGNGHEEPSYYYQGPAPIVGGLEKDESFRTTESSDYMDITARQSINSTISDLGASYTTRSEKLTASMWRSGLMQDIEENQLDDLTEATDKKDNSTRDGSFVAGGWQDSSHASHGASTHEESKETSQHGSSHNDDIYEFDEPDLSRTKEATKRYHSFHGGDQPHKGETTSLAVRKVLKILRYFSRILSAMEPMAQHHGLVDALLYQITKDPLSIDDEDEIAARVDALAVIVNLACAEENKIMLCYHPGLLDSMISISNHDLAEEAREYSAIVLMNLAYAEEVKVC